MYLKEIYNHFYFYFLWSKILLFDTDKFCVECTESWTKLKKLFFKIISQGQS